MKSESDFYLDRAAKCLDMAEQVDKQYRGDLLQIARGWVQLAREEAGSEGEKVELGAGLENLPSTDGPQTAMC